MVAGPNGAGKTTLYETAIKDLYPDAEFINADELARRHFGHPAVTIEQSKYGQDAAEQRRRELLAARKSFVTESTFSHPSKLDLLSNARDQGYEVRVYHVHVRSPALSVARVASRVERGGHPVPEDKIRERYERNQSLIRDAVRFADRARVYDNSRLNEPHRIAIDFRNGIAVRVSENVPAWARELYAQDLARFEPSQVNPPAASFERAWALARRALGENSKLYIARPGGRYAGSIVGQTDEHVVQQLSQRSAVAHFRDRLDRSPAIGEQVVVTYSDVQRSRASVRSIERARPLTTEVAARIDRVVDGLRVVTQRIQAGDVRELGIVASAARAIGAGRDQEVREVLNREPVVLDRFEEHLKRLGALRELPPKGQER